MPRLAAAFGLLVLVPLAGAEEQSTREQDDPGRSPIASPAPRVEFEEICRALRASDEIYFGEAPAAYLARRLEQPFDNPLTKAGFRFRYARELLELGRPLEAIGLLEQNLVFARSMEPWQAAWMLRTLGLAHLQAAEDANCLERHSADSCILPIRGEGVHSQPERARQAALLFLRLLEGNPDDAVVAWLLNLSAMAAGDYPEAVPERFRAVPERVGSPRAPEAWIDRAPELGVAVVDPAGGAVMDDFDGDGLLDLLSMTSDPCGSMKAYRNDGRGGFTEVTAEWGLDGQLGGLNLIQADYDNDGRLDLLVLRGAWLLGHGRIRNSLLRNELGPEGGRFADRTRAAGVAEPAVPTQTAAWADYDLDGDLDLYLGNETSDEVEADSQLFRNNGDGTFTDVARPFGVTAPEGRSFTSWFFDYDNDGDLDLFVADYSVSVEKAAAYFLGRDTHEGQPLLYRNDGGRFTEVSRSLGLEAPVLVMGANHGDVDNDGFPDVYLGTGDPEFESLLPNLLLRNRGAKGFEEATAAFRLGYLQKGHGVAFGDVDNDGDLDLFHQLGGFYPGDAYANALFENPGNTNRWITLRLEGRRANRFGVGARVTVRVRQDGVARSIHSLVGSGGSFGGSSLQQEIGLGAAEAVEEIVVRWPGSDSGESFGAAALDGTYRVVEGRGELEELRVVPIKLGSRPVSSSPAEGVR